MNLQFVKNYKIKEKTVIHSDNSLAKKILLWSPKIDIDTGLELTIDWVNKYKKYYA